MTVETANQVRKLCLAIRTRTDNYSVDIKHWLRDLHSLQERGWSPGALPVIQLETDAKTLHALAWALERQHFEMTTQPEKPNESA